MVIVIPALIITALTYLGAFGIIGIGGSVVSWTIYEILKAIAIGVVGIAFLAIGVWMLWKNKKKLGRLGKADWKTQLPLIIPIVLLFIGGAFIDPEGLGQVMMPFLHIALFAFGVLLVWKYILPVLENKIKNVSDLKLAVASMAAMFFFVLGIPGVVFSVGGHNHGYEH